MGSCPYILALVVIQFSRVWMCPSNCNCTGSVTTCCGQGAVSTLSQPLAGNSDTRDTKSLVLDHCGVFNLDMTTFQNFLPLEFLEIRRMVIVYVDSQAFMHLSELQTLVLDNVSLSNGAMHPNAFAGLRANVLSLRNNLLCTVTQQTFTDSENLEHIDLSGNQLGFIEDKAFTRLVKLKRLNLTNNRLKTVSLFWFGVSFLKTDFQLVLLGNNLSCECQFRGSLHQGNEWFTQAIASNNLTCNWTSAAPPCEAPSVATTYKEVYATELLTLSLSCGADGLPQPSVIWFLPNGTRVVDSSLPSEDGVLHLPSVGLQSSGLYACLASNTEGSAIGLTRLTVVPTPTAAATPSSAMVVTNSTAARVRRRVSVEDGLIWGVVVMICTILSVVFFCLMKNAIECWRYKAQKEIHFDKFVDSPIIQSLPKNPHPLSHFENENPFSENPAEFLKLPGLQLQRATEKTCHSSTA